LGAFGLAAKRNPFKRPKDDTVLLTKHEQRHEPFWYVAARRAVAFTRRITYAVHVGNVHAHLVLINGAPHPITAQGKKRSINLAAVEVCHRKIVCADFVDGLGREIKRTTLEHYVSNDKSQEQLLLNLPEAIALKLRATTLRQRIDQTLSNEVINAHEIQQDTRTLEKSYIYYRPVFAFEFAWTTEDKVGVIEVDGLTGEVVENGQWFKDKIGAIATREMLFEARAEIAGALVPGGGLAVKVIEKITSPS